MTEFSNATWQFFKTNKEYSYRRTFKSKTASLVAPTCQEPTCQSRDTGSIHGSGRYPGEWNGNPLQYSCLENPMDRGPWWATVHRVAKESNTTWWLNNNSLIHKIIFFSFFSPSENPLAFWLPSWLYDILTQLPPLHSFYIIPIVNSVVLFCWFA